MITLAHIITLKVDGMTCGHCVAAVSRALAQVPGVERVVEVSLERGEAILEGHAQNTNRNRADNSYR